MEATANWLKSRNKKVIKRRASFTTYFFIATRKVAHIQIRVYFSRIHTVGIYWRLRYVVLLSSDDR